MKWDGVTPRWTRCNFKYPAYFEDPITKETSYVYIGKRPGSGWCITDGWDDGSLEIVAGPFKTLREAKVMWRLLYPRSSE